LLSEENPIGVYFREQAIRLKEFKIFFFLREKSERMVIYYTKNQTGYSDQAKTFVTVRNKG